MARHPQTPRAGTRTEQLRSQLWRRRGVALLLALLLGVATLGPARTAHAATVTDCPTTETALSMDISNAGAGGTVQFNCVGSTSIPFTRAIDITQSVTLDASGILASIALDASSTRFFTVEAGASLGLTRIIMNNGTAVRAGAIDNSGSLTMTNSYIEVSQGSVAGAIVNEAHSTATITDSDLSTNSGTNGGAIYNDGTMTVSDSSFIYDSVLGGGDGAILEGSDGSATISNSTFQADQAVGGAAIENLSGGTVTLTNSTLAQNTVEYPITGAGMVNNGGPKSAFSIGGSILAGAGETNACSGLFTDLGYNLEDVASSTCGFSAGNNDGVGHDPQLGAPATNDALTYTMALGATSPAIDVIPSASCPATDQRLAPRPDASEAKCDIGAYESGGVVPPPPVPPLATTTLTTVQHPGISFGDTVTFITYVQASGVPPTGSVTFYNDGSPIGTTPLTPVGSFTSIATFSTCALPGSPGGASYQITSSYSGDTNFKPSADTTGKTETVFPCAGVSACATGISDGVGTTAVVGGSGLGSSGSYGAQATGGMVGIDWMSVQSLSGDPVGSAPPEWRELPGRPARAKSRLPGLPAEQHLHPGPDRRLQPRCRSEQLLLAQWVHLDEGGRVSGRLRACQLSRLRHHHGWQWRHFTRAVRSDRDVVGLEHQPDVCTPEPNVGGVARHAGDGALDAGGAGRRDWVPDLRRETVAVPCHDPGARVSPVPDDGPRHRPAYPEHPCAAAVRR